MLNKLWRFIVAFIPRQLPTGLTSFNKLVSDIVWVSGLPDNDSTRSLAAQFIIHSPMNKYYFTVNDISKQLVKAASYQVASQVVKDTATNDKTIS